MLWYEFANKIGVDAKVMHEMTLQALAASWAER